jgi:hypothetical protein
MLFFRWIKKGSADLAAAKNKRLLYTNHGDPSDKCFWVFEKGARYEAGSRLRRDRVLVAFDFGDMGEEVIKNRENWIDFEDANFEGEAEHPRQIIVKSNEPGAYGVGADILGHLYVKEARLATQKEVAKSLNLNEKEVSKQSW